MKKALRLLTLTFGAAVLCTGASAQMADGSTAPNWTLTDIDGNTHTLYDYLDQGYSVVMDFSATWCGPCWNYHTSGALEALYAENGPAGMTGVSVNTTDLLIVFMIEGDGSTTSADLHGTGGNTWGDWTAGVDYPIIDDASITSLYQIGYWPTIYKICPDRFIEEIGQASTEAHAEASNECIRATGATVDGSALRVDGVSAAPCGDTLDVIPTVTILNLGTENLTSATLTSLINGNPTAEIEWTGDLGIYESAEVQMPQFTMTGGTDEYSVELTLPNGVADEADDNNMLTLVTKLAKPTDYEVTIEVKLDAYPQEVGWAIKDADGNTVVERAIGYYAGSANGTASEQYTFPSDWMCYTLEVVDDYGDGLLNGGYVKMKTATETTIEIPGDSYDDSAVVPFKIDHTPTGVEGISVVQGFSVYPNPMSSNATVSLGLEENSKVTMSVVNVLGETVYTKDFGTMSAGSRNLQLDAANLNAGIYFLSVNVNNEKLTKRVTITK